MMEFQLCKQMNFKGLIKIIKEITNNKRHIIYLPKRKMMYNGLRLN